MVGLEDAWDMFNDAGGWDSAPDSMKKAMEMAVMRAPAPSVSGTRVLRFDGFVDTPGYGLQAHQIDMGYLGGADKDIDTAAFFQDMPQEYMDALKKYEREWEEDGKYVVEKLREDLFVKEAGQPSAGMMDAVDARALLRANIGAAKGKKTLSSGLVFANVMMPYYRFKLEKMERKFW